MAQSNLVLLRSVAAGLVLGVFGPILPSGFGARVALTAAPEDPGVPASATLDDDELPSEEQALLQRLSQAEGMLRIGRPDVAAQMAEGLPLRGPHGAATLRVRGWALLESGAFADLAELLAPWSHLRGELLFLRGSGRRRAADRVGGLDDLQRQWWQEPETVWGLAALRELAEDPELFSDGDQEAIRAALPRANSASSVDGHRFAGRLLDELSRKVRSGGRLSAEVHRAIGLRLLRSEEFTSAVKELRLALKQSQAPELRRATLLALGEAERRRGNTKRATKHFDTVLSEGGDATTDHLSQRALASAGQMFIEYRRYPEAQARFQEQLLLNPVGPARQNALWGLGWVAFRTGSFASARRFFETLLTEAPFGPRAAQAAYWAARALQEMGYRDNGRAELAAVLSRYPVSYYAYRAETHLGDGPVPQAATLPGGRDARVERIDELLAAGMQERAKGHLVSLSKNGRDSLGPDDLDRLVSMATTLGAERAAKRFGTQRDRRFPDGGRGGLRPLERLFPKTYTRLTTRAARASRVDAHLAIALTRQESGFNPRAVSSAGALGLMQLMPATARELMREKHRRSNPSTESILEPKTNLELGTRYLGRMLRAFRGRQEYALAAYNAGPGAVTRWRQSRGDLPEEIFVEEIPYRETREYVRRVLGLLRTWQIVDQARSRADRAPTELAQANARHTE